MSELPEYWQATQRPSKAAMREAREIVNRYGCSYDFIQEIALVLDRHAAAERERCAKIAKELFVVEPVHVTGNPFRLPGDSYWLYEGDVEAAIRSASYE